MTESGSGNTHQQLKQGTYVNLGEVVIKSPLKVRSRDVTISSSTLNTVVKEFTEEIQIESFRALKAASLHERNGTLLKVSDEANPCGEKMIAPQEETTFPSILQQEDLHQIYNGVCNLQYITIKIYSLEDDTRADRNRSKLHPIVNAE